MRISAWIPYKWHNFYFEKIINGLRKKKQECLVSNDVKEIINFKPQILLMAEKDYDKFKKISPIFIYIPHGVSSKNVTYNILQKNADYICCVSELMKEEYIKRNILPKKDFWITGLPQQDVFFRDINKNGVNYIKGNVLYAPTYQYNLSSAYSIGEYIIKYLIKEKFKTYIKFHPIYKQNNSYEAIIKFYEKNQNKDAVCRNQNKLSTINSFDDCKESMCLISDCSGVIFDYLILEKPIFLYNNSLHKQEKIYYDKKGWEWDLREELAYCFNDIKIFKNKFRSVIIEKNDYKKQKRKKIKDIVFGKIQDGKASENIVKNILSLGENFER